MSESTEFLPTAEIYARLRTRASGPPGELPITPEMLANEPSGNLFGLTQNAGMGWRPSEVGRPPYLILSTAGGTRGPNGEPLALGYHTGHWEISLLVEEAARTLRERGMLPFSATCSDPCDGRSQGTRGMFDSLPYRNDAAITLRRLIRSLPQRLGVLGIATCDKGLPAMMLALAGCADLPGVIVPGGVTLPAIDAEDAGKVQTIGARFVHGLIDLQHAADMGCRACGSPGGGCQFLGTAATAQIVAEALGMALPHSALCPSGEPVWLDLARRSALALVAMAGAKRSQREILTPGAFRNALLIHAAFGGSTNLLLHIPAIAHAAGISPPTVEDWAEASRAIPRIVDALPNGPRNHPTVQVFLAGGVPEVMLHLRAVGLLDLSVPTASGLTLGTVLDWWQDSEVRRASRAKLRDADGIDPDDVIMGPDEARRRGFGRTLVFPVGNIAPQGSVIKAAALDPALFNDSGTFTHRGPARVFTRERDAILAIKGDRVPPIGAGDVIVLAGCGPAGTGMEETYQITSALKFLPWGSSVAVLTDARFSGVSTGACIGHIGPEALAGGPIGKLRDGDLVAIEIDRELGRGSLHFLGANGVPDPDADAVLAARTPHPGLAAHPDLPADTVLWAALQQASGGTWAGCVYDAERISHLLRLGLAAEAATLKAERTSEP